MGQEPVAGWKYVVAFFIDLFGSIVLFGGAISLVTGDCHGSSFELTGLPALLAIALTVGYFVLFTRLGGTPGRRILGIPRTRKRSETSSG
jgi:hypothetical protein